MIRTETNVSHETAIAIAWLKECKRSLEMGRPVYKLTDRFDAIVSEWEEEGVLRENHRKLSLEQAKKAAVTRLKNSPKWRVVFDHFTKPQFKIGDDVEVTCDEWEQPELYFVSKRFKNGNLTLRSYYGNEAIRLNERTRRKFQVRPASRDQKFQVARQLDAAAREAAIYQRHGEASKLRNLATHLTA